MKQTVIKSVTALLCVIAVCVCSTLAIGKITTAMVDVAKLTPAAPASSTGTGSNVTGDDTTPTADDQSAVPTDDTAAPDASDPAADANAGTTDSDASSTGSSSSAGNANSGSASSTAADPTKYSKAQIVDYYNNAIKNTAKAAKLTVTKTENIDIQVDTMKPDSDTLKKIINENVLSKYAKPSTDSKSFTNGVASDKTKASDYLPKSRLEAAGVKTASIVKNGSNYVVTIVTIAEKTTLQNPKAKYVEQCAAPLDLASVDLGPIKIIQADMNYPGVTIKATVSANGTLVSSSIDQPLNGTGTANVIGLKPSATVHGAWTQKNTYKY